MQIITDTGISSRERDQLLHALQEQLIELRYDEEASISAMIEAGDDVSRSGSAPWAVLMIEIEQQQGGRCMKSAGGIGAAFLRLLRAAPGYSVDSKGFFELIDPSAGPVGECPEPNNRRQPAASVLSGVAGTQRRPHG